jgi:hypothetical protein
MAEGAGVRGAAVGETVTNVGAGDDSLGNGEGDGSAGAEGLGDGEGDRCAGAVSKSGGEAAPRGVGAPQATRYSATTSQKTITRLILLTNSSFAHSRDGEPSVRNPGR